MSAWVRRRGWSGGASAVRHYKIGVVPVSLRSVYRRAADDFASLYGEHECERQAPGAIEIDVVRTRVGRGVRRGYKVFADGIERFIVWTNHSVLPHIEWAINWHVALYLPKLFAVHSGAVQVHGQGVLFPAAPGGGKSTLVAGLLARGHRYFSDEFALIDPETRLLAPFPKAICVKKGSFDAVRRLGIAPDRRGDYVKGMKGRVRFVTPRQFGPGVTASPCPVRRIMFCRYVGGRPSIKPVSRADAVLRLTRLSFNFVKFRSRGIELLADVVRSADCLELSAGDLEPTCKLVESVLTNAGRDIESTSGPAASAA